MKRNFTLGELGIWLPQKNTSYMIERFIVSYLSDILSLSIMYCIFLPYQNVLNLSIFWFAKNLIKFRTVRKYENYIHLRGVKYMNPPKKYLLHEREIHSVLYLGHFESLYHVMYFFAESDCSKFFNNLILPKIKKFRTVRKYEKYFHLRGAGYIAPPKKIPFA